jgi:hypothetical protein
MRQTDIGQKQFNVWALTIDHNYKEMPTNPNPEPIIFSHAYSLYVILLYLYVR